MLFRQRCGRTVTIRTMMIAATFLSFVATAAVAVAGDDVMMEKEGMSTAGQQQPSLFNEYMVLQRHNFPINPYDELLLETNQQLYHHQRSSSDNGSQDIASSRLRSHTTSRNLFLFGTATGSICSLSSDIFYFDQDPISQLYYWNGDKNDLLYSEVDSIWNSTVLDRWKVAEQIQIRRNVTNTVTFGTNETNITSVAVRACLCTQYLNRPIEFCSAEFLSCSVRTTPVECFTISSTDTFIESFWPVTIFWMLVVTYVWSCSDPGRVARQYYQRKFRCWQYCRTNRPLENTNTDTNTSEQTIEGQAPLTDDQIVRQQLESTIENYPSRANYMYREAMNRQNRQQRYERQRQSLRWYRTYQRMKTRFKNFLCCYKPIISTNINVIADNNIENVDETPAVEMTNQTNMSPGVTEPSGPRLILKTRVYYFDDAATRVATDTSRKYSSFEQPQTEFPEVTAGIAPSNVASEAETILIDDNDNSNSNLNNGDEIRCAICLLPLQDGIDIIGDLPCHHCMHKHCLKEWLMRKNRCPLCQLSDVAEFQDATHSTSPSVSR